MKRSPALGVAVGTLVAAISLWFGLLALTSNPPTGIAIMAIGGVFAMYAMVAFSGAEDASTVAFKAALTAVSVAIVTAVLYSATTSEIYLIGAPVAAIGMGGAIGLPPDTAPFRLGFRVAGVVLAAMVAVAVFWVDTSIYALVAPLLPLPAVALSDNLFGRTHRIVRKPADS